VYLSPEAILSQPVSAPCDWWALGVLLFELLCGYTPFGGDNPKKVGEAICNSRVRFPRTEDDEGGDEGGAPPAASTAAAPAAAAPTAADGAAAPFRYPPISALAVSIVRKLLTKKPEARLGSKGGVEEIKAQPFLKPIDWEALAAGKLERPFVPTLAADTDVRYFERRHTSHAQPLSAVEADAATEAEGVAAVKAAEAKAAELKARERQLAIEAEAARVEAVAARKAAAMKAVADARAAELGAAEEAVAEAQRQVRNAQKKLRLTLELQEGVESGKLERLDKAQREKVRGIPKLKEEVSERLEHAAEMESALQAVQSKLAGIAKAEAEAKRQEERSQREAAKAKEEGERRMAELASKTAKVVIGDKAETVELLTMERFAFVGPEWRAAGR
jgi:hypothetical protein